MSNHQSILSLCDVSYSTPDGRSLGTKINIDLIPGEILLVTGANGSGKSTLLEVILGRRTCDSGSVQINIPTSSVSYLPQLQDNLTHMPFSLRDVLMVSMATSVDDDKIAGVGLLTKEHLDLAWNSASGGEKRRTLLTRTLLRQPELLILDEPFNHLDSDSRSVMVSSIRHFVGVMKKCVILSTHEGFANDAAVDELIIKYIAL